MATVYFLIILVLLSLLDINDNKLNTIKEDNEKQPSIAKNRVFTGRQSCKKCGEAVTKKTNAWFFLFS